MKSAPVSFSKIFENFPKALIQEAYANSLAKVKYPNQIRSGLTITKSIAEKKRKTKQTGSL